MKKAVIMAVLVLAALAAAYVLIAQRSAGRERDVLELSGTIEVTEANIAFKIPGRIVRLLAEEGSMVEKDEPMAVLDSGELAGVVDQNLAAARSAEVLLTKARKDLERFEALRSQDAVSAQQLDAARSAHGTAEAQHQAALASVRTSEARLHDASVAAPLTGMVLRKHAEAGETIAAGMPVYTIGVLDEPWIKVYVREDRLGLVKIGQRAKIRTDARPQKEYDGEVTYLSSEAEFTPKNVQTREERVKLVFAVKVRVRNENQELKPGMPADVKIMLK